MRRAVVLCALVGSAAAGQSPAKEARPEQGVNWKGQVIRAVGQGAPDMKAANPAQARLGAEMAAKVDALRNLLAQVKGVAIDSTRKMGDAMEDDRIRARVEGVVKGFTIVNKRYFSDTGVEIEVEVPLAMLTDLVDPDATQLLAVAATGANEPARASGPPATGLVIDARGLKLTPALLPRVLDEKGAAVYSVDSLSKDARKTSAVAAYVQSLEEAHRSMKAGEKPLVVKAARASGADLELPEGEVKRVLASNPGFLADGKVVIVLN